MFVNGAAHLGSSHLHVSQDSLMILAGFTELAQPLPLLGDNEEVSGSLGIDILENQDFAILVHNLK